VIVVVLFAALHTSLSGTSRSSEDVRLEWAKADVEIWFKD